MSVLGLGLGWGLLALAASGLYRPVSLPALALSLVGVLAVTLLALRSTLLASTAITLAGFYRDGTVRLAWCTAVAMAGIFYFFRCVSWTLRTPSSASP